MNACDALNRFGRLLMEEVRDETLEEWRLILNGDMNDEESLEIVQLLQQCDNKSKHILFTVVPDIVNSVLHNLLFMLETEEDIKLLFKNIDISETSDGLAGELFSEDGWIAKYSAEHPGHN